MRLVGGINRPTERRNLQLYRKIPKRRGEGGKRRTNGPETHTGAAGLGKRGERDRI